MDSPDGRWSNSYGDDFYHPAHREGPQPPHPRGSSPGENDRDGPHGYPSGAAELPGSTGDSFRTRIAAAPPLINYWQHQQQLQRLHQLQDSNSTLPAHLAPSSQLSRNHPFSRSLRSWAHEPPNDSCSESGSSISHLMHGGAAAGSAYSCRRRASSAGSTTADSEMTPTSSRASPRPIAPNFHQLTMHFPPHGGLGGMQGRYPATESGPGPGATRAVAVPTVAVQAAAEGRASTLFPATHNTLVQRPIARPPPPAAARGLDRSDAVLRTSTEEHRPAPDGPATGSNANQRRNSSGSGSSATNSNRHSTSNSGTTPASSATAQQPPPAAPAAQPSPPAAAAPRFIAIGIDFGTTYSGASWAFSGSPDDIKDVQQYPCASSAASQQGRDDAQVPTVFDQRTGAWGYLVDAKEHAPIKWFKLLLLRDADIRHDIRHSPYLQAARQQAARLGDDGVIDLVARFLHNLWQHCLREIELQVEPRVLENLPFRVAITVPAIWPQYARNMMKEAARRAGLFAPRDIGDTTLILVEEPEAAALATLRDRRSTAYANAADMVGEGHTFVVVDAGGGTVDIISYKVVATAPRFRIREAVCGDGRLCGAFLVDDKFEAHMKHHAGLRFDRCDPAEFRRFVRDEWEYAIKRAGDLQLPEYYLRPPAKVFSRVARLRGTSEYVMKNSTVVEFFEETLQGIRALILDQTQKIIRQEGQPPKNILLVGGLGSSRYLYRKLQAEYGNVMQPQRAWSSVARGAVIKLLTTSSFDRRDMVPAADPLQQQFLLRPLSVLGHQLSMNNLPVNDASLARFSYGVETGVPVDRAYPPVDPAVDRVSHEPDGQQRVWRMQWYLRQGEAMDNKAPVSHKFYEYVTSAKRTHTEFAIYTHKRGGDGSGSDDDGGNHDDPGNHDGEPAPHVKDATCRLLCTIHCDYDTPFHELPIVDEARGVRLVDNMRLTMRFNGEPEWHLQVGNNATEHKVDVEYE